MRSQSAPASFPAALRSCGSIGGFGGGGANGKGAGPMTDRRNTSRHIRARRGNEIVAKSWSTEAAVRMLMNNLDDEVAEDPQSLVVYGGIGRAARNWECYVKIVETLERLDEDH